MNRQVQLATLPGLPNESGEPVFESPWQAKTFAMTMQLYESGAFTWVEWADELSKNIADFEVDRSIQCSDDYYSLWHLSLEQMLARKGLIVL